MAVRVFSSLDSGAPVLAGSDFQRFKAVLLACLVKGYPGRPAAGWTVGHESADGLGFSVGNGAGYANFVDNGSGYAVAYIMETITDGSMALAGGYNRRSATWVDGSSQVARNYQYIRGLTLSNPHWLLIADNKTAYVMAGGNYPTADFVSWYSAAFAMGEYINPQGISGFVFAGGHILGSNGMALLGSRGVAGMVSRNPLTGLVGQGNDAGYTACPAVFTRIYPLQVRQVLSPGRLMPVRAALVGWGTTISGSSSPDTWATLGYFRGMVSEPSLSGAKLSRVLSLFGKPNIWQSRVQPLSLPSGKIWYPFYPFDGDDGFFISTDPADWG